MIKKLVKKPAIRGNYCISSNSILLLNAKISKILITLLQKTLKYIIYIEKNRRIDQKQNRYIKKLFKNK